MGARIINKRQFSKFEDVLEFQHKFGDLGVKSNLALLCVAALDAVGLPVGFPLHTVGVPVWGVEEGRWTHVT